MKIIGISGKAESGKTYAANVIKSLLPDNLKVEIIPLASTLKAMAKDLGWDGKKDERGRTFLQDLGKIIKAYHGGDIFARWVVEEAEKRDLDALIIDDVRMKDEVEFLKDAYLIRIDRVNSDNKPYVNSLTEEQRKDISEVDLDNYDFDKYFLNKGDARFDLVLNDFVSYFIVHEEGE